MGSSAGSARGLLLQRPGEGGLNDNAQNEDQIADVRTRLLELADKIQKAINEDEAGEQELRGIADKLLNILFVLSSEKETNRASLFRSGRSPQCSTGVTSLWRSTETAAKVLRPFSSYSPYRFFAAYRF
ncbi:hypothetical protein ACFWNH_02045 [Rhodococcus qingshengii]|uniref:hypothetical protein n=1 Tax=Rhodococcus qingshengii TaxID=334542 RepID=UPI0036577FC8